MDAYGQRDSGEPTVADTQANLIETTDDATLLPGRPDLPTTGTGSPAEPRLRVPHPEEADDARGGRLGGVLLKRVLAEQLHRQNVIRFKKREHTFSEGNILATVQALDDIVDDGLLRTHEKVYALLCLGRSMQQPIDGDTKSFQLD